MSARETTTNGTSAVASANQIPKVCYTDIQLLWTTRGLYTHRMPYVHVPEGSGDIASGGLEYPVLTGLVVFFTAQTADTDREFLIASAAVLIPLMMLTTTLLVDMRGRRALLFALGTPVLLFSVYNWDALPLACSVAAIWAWSGRSCAKGFDGSPLLAGALLGLGGAAKLYPLVFVVPLLVDRLRARNRRSAARLLIGAVGTFLAVNLPFVAINSTGWKLTYLFQRTRATRELRQQHLVVLPTSM